MMDKHSEKCPDDDPRFNLTHCPVRLAFADVLADKSVNLRDKLAEEPLRKLVLLESRLKEQTHKALVLLLVRHRLEG